MDQMFQPGPALGFARRPSAGMLAAVKWDQDLPIGVVVLAAGRSSRMGCPKMLLPWGETTVLGHLLDAWTRLPARQVAVVYAHGDTAVAGELDRLRVPEDSRILNPDPDRGMFSSIICAAQWSGWSDGLAHWAIVLGDQPHLRPGTLASLAAFAARHPVAVCQPTRLGHGRHPVLLPAAVFRQLALSRDATLKDFLKSSATRVELMKSDDPGLDLDLDTPEDYRNALRMFPTDNPGPAPAG
jgi:molybdenum cofactor cytidylyltransferase